ncbi:PPPDE putative peptidase domain [Trinorchestia longiramus]|nr:PPPDE putative peptidase domain [Trinorchestia longiramus]
MDPDDDCAYRVELFVYDLTRGLARTLSSTLLGKQIDGIWHTGVVAYGREYFFGSGGIESCKPGGTILGEPDRIEDLGESQVPYQLFLEYIFGLGESAYRPGAYDLLKHNCNNFSDEIAQFLCGRGIPKSILQLPEEVLNTPLGLTLNETLKKLELKHASSRSINFGPLSSSALGPAISTVRRTSYHDPEFDALNDAIEQVRHNSVILEERRNSLNDKLSKKERKERRREKRERKEQRRRARSEAGDDRVLRKKKKNKPPLPPSSGESSSLSTSVSRHSRDTFNHIDDHDDVDRTLEVPASSGARDFELQNHEDSQLPDEGFTETVTEATASVDGLRLSETANSVTEVAEETVSDWEPVDDFWGSQAPDSPLVVRRSSSYLAPSSEPELSPSPPQLPDSSPPSPPPVYFTDMEDAPPPEAAERSAAPPPPAEPEEPEVEREPPILFKEDVDVSIEDSTNPLRCRVSTSLTPHPSPSPSPSSSPILIPPSPDLLLDSRSPTPPCSLSSFSASPHSSPISWSRDLRSRSSSASELEFGDNENKNTANYASKNDSETVGKSNESTDVQYQKCYFLPGEDSKKNVCEEVQQEEDELQDEVKNNFEAQQDQKLLPSPDQIPRDNKDNELIQNQCYQASPSRQEFERKKTLEATKMKERELVQLEQGKRGVNKVSKGRQDASAGVAKAEQKSLQSVQDGSSGMSLPEQAASSQKPSLVRSNENISSPVLKTRQDASLLALSSNKKKLACQHPQDEAKVKVYDQTQSSIKQLNTHILNKEKTKVHPDKKVEPMHTLPVEAALASQECRNDKQLNDHKNVSSGQMRLPEDSKRNINSEDLPSCQDGNKPLNDSQKFIEITSRVKTVKPSNPLKNSTAKRESIESSTKNTEQELLFNVDRAYKCPQVALGIESKEAGISSSFFKDPIAPSPKNKATRPNANKKDVIAQCAVNSDELFQPRRNHIKNTVDDVKTQSTGLVHSPAIPKTCPNKPSALALIPGHNTTEGKGLIRNLENSEVHSYSSPSTPLAPTPEVAPLRRNLTEDIAKFLKRTAPAEVAKRFSCPVYDDGQFLEPAAPELKCKITTNKPFNNHKKPEHQPEIHASNISFSKDVSKNGGKSDKKPVARGEDVIKEEIKEAPRQSQDITSNSMPVKTKELEPKKPAANPSPIVNFDDLGGEAPKTQYFSTSTDRGVDNALLCRPRLSNPRPPPPYRPRAQPPRQPVPRTSLVRGAPSDLVRPQPLLHRTGSGPRLMAPNMGASSLRGFCPVVIAPKGSSVGLPPPYCQQTAVLVRSPLMNGVGEPPPGRFISPALVTGAFPVETSPVAVPMQNSGQWVAVPTHPHMLIGSEVYNEDVLTSPPVAKIAISPDSKLNSSANAFKTSGTNPKQSQEKTGSHLGTVWSSEVAPIDDMGPANSNVIETKFHIYPPDYYARQSGETCDSPGGSECSSYETSRDSSSSSLCRSSTSSSSMSFGSSYYMLYVVDPIERPATPHESLSSPETSPTPDDAAQGAVSSPTHSGLVKSDSNSSVISFRTITPEPEYFDANDKAFRELRGISRGSSDESLNLHRTRSPSRGSISTLKMSSTKSSMDSAISSRTSPPRKARIARHRSQPSSPNRRSPQVSRACSLESLSSFLRRVPRAPSTLASLSSLDLPILSPSRSPPPVAVDRPPSTDSLILFPTDEDENQEPSVLYRPVPRYSGSSSPPSLPSQLCLLGPSRSHEDPLTFPAVARQARRDFDDLVGSCMHQLTPEEQQHMEELRAYVVQDDGAWALGENFGDLFTRIFHDPNIPDAARLHLTRILAVAALKDDVILLLHQDRKDHTIMNFANKVEHLSPQLQEAIALFFCNMFEHVSPSEWLLYISEWTLEGSQPISNIRVTTKVAVNALLHSSDRVQNYGTALMYNLGTKEVKTVVFDDVAPELAMAILQYFNTKPKEELLWRTMTALCRFCYASNEVPSLIKMIGPEPSTFKGMSERIDSVIEEITVKLSRKLPVVESPSGKNTGLGIKKVKNSRL